MNPLRADGEGIVMDGFHPGVESFLKVLLYLGEVGVVVEIV